MGQPGREENTLSCGRSDPIGRDAFEIRAHGRVLIMRIEHALSEKFLKRRAVRVLIIGAGGTGSAILMGLPYLHQAMLVWGHPCGLAVTVMDPDTVSPTNCVRQPFSTSDMGLK
ncbi:MAG: hypothetical protein QOJ51_290 [Acidobacteriaceae bacterium]|nr:hypothetical protein [Acidobacteriaceae bacterium]